MKLLRSSAVLAIVGLLLSSFLQIALTLSLVNIFILVVVAVPTYYFFCSTSTSTSTANNIKSKWLYFFLFVSIVYASLSTINSIYTGYGFLFALSLTLFLILLITAFYSGYNFQKLLYFIYLLFSIYVISSAIIVLMLKIISLLSNVDFGFDIFTSVNPLRIYGVFFSDKAFRYSGFLTYPINMALVSGFCLLYFLLFDNKYLTKYKIILFIFFSLSFILAESKTYIISFILVYYLSNFRRLIVFSVFILCILCILCIFPFLESFDFSNSIESRFTIWLDILSGSDKYSNIGAHSFIFEFFLRYGVFVGAIFFIFYAALGAVCLICLRKRQQSLGYIRICLFFLIGGSFDNGISFFYLKIETALFFVSLLASYRQKKD